MNIFYNQATDKTEQTSAFFNTIKMKKRKINNTVDTKFIIRKKKKKEIKRKREEI